MSRGKNVGEAELPSCDSAKAVLRSGRSSFSSSPRGAPGDTGLPPAPLESRFSPEGGRGVLGLQGSVGQGQQLPGGARRLQRHDRRPGPGWSRGPSTLPPCPPSDPRRWDTTGQPPSPVGDGRVEKDTSSLVRGEVGQKVRRKPLPPRKGLKWALSEGQVCPGQSLGPSQPPILKRRLLKTQHPFPLTKSSTSSVFPVVLLESFPDRADRPLGARSPVSAVLPVPSLQESEEGGR